MKIATWNIDRLKSLSKSSGIIRNLKEIDADILILTEYNKLLHLPYYQYKVETNKILDNQYNYKETETRVAIFSKFPIRQIFKTYDNQTSCCAEFETDFGNLIVYGTIVGIVGNSDKNFKADLIKQTEDIESLSKLGSFCYSGDLNISFSDNYYFTQFGREKFLESFRNNRLTNLTGNLKENIDHIIISEDFIKNLNHEISEWNTSKNLSDHKGVLLELK